VRKATVTRETNETSITLTLDLDGTGTADISTGVGFFDHMLNQLARHGLFDLQVQAKGDLHIDPHHTVEDVGICLGKAFLEALGDMKGLTRYGQAVVPLDEALVEVVVDVSGRPYLVFDVELPPTRVGEFDTELAEEFFRAFAVNSRTTVHALLRHGKNTHHCIEALFKAWARSLRNAVALDARVVDVPSTKGMLET
jgi:imidazoleglycerol-phosphate dehydratase